jgi:chitinase
MIHLSKGFKLAAGVLIGILLPAATWAVQAPAPTPQPPTKVVGAFFAEWDIYGANFVLGDVQAKGSAAKLNQIYYAFAKVTPAGCAIADAWADYQIGFTAAQAVNGVGDSGYNWSGVGTPVLQGNFNQLRELKALNPNLKVLISLGGSTGSAAFSQAASTAAMRHAFVASCIDLFIKGDLLAQDYSAPIVPGIFDGIDVDWETPGDAHSIAPGTSADTVNFTALLMEFRNQLNAQGAADSKTYLLTAELPAGPQNYSNIDLPTISEYALLDYYNVMAYDYSGSWDTITGILAPLYSPSWSPVGAQLSIDQTIQGYLAGNVPSWQINMGMPFYGTGWSGASSGYNGGFPTGLYQAGTPLGTTNYGVLEPSPGVYPPGFTLGRDGTSQAPSLYNPATGTFWSFDDTTSIQYKNMYVESCQAPLAGEVAWELSGDDSAGTLVSAMAGLNAPQAGCSSGIISRPALVD